MPKIVYMEKRFSARTWAIIEQAERIVEQYKEQGYDLTLRQLFYQFVSRALLPNTEQSYTKLGNVISDARRAGLIDWDDIVDRTRMLRDNPHWSHPKDILQGAAQQFALDMWANQRVRLETWIEKDALVGVIAGFCRAHDIPYFSCRGYSSDSAMWRAAQRIARRDQVGQRTIVLHLGDHDPSGLDMTDDIRSRLELFTFGACGVEVKRIALNMEQILQYNPPPNPAKVTDSRYEAYVARYGVYSWELDALEPNVLSDLIREQFEEYVDIDLWNETIERQLAYREQIVAVIDKWDEIHGEE